MDLSVKLITINRAEVDNDNNKGYLLIQDATSSGSGPWESVALRPSFPWILGIPDDDQLRISPMAK